jgi:hypothetical protein
MKESGELHRKPFIKGQYAAKSALLHKKGRNVQRLRSE